MIRPDYLRPAHREPHLFVQVLVLAIIGGLIGGMVALCL